MDGREAGSARTYAAFHKLLFAPKSAQLPHAPIWLGGEVEGARQLYGDALAGVRAEAERAGRDPSQIVGAMLAIYWRIGTEQQGREGRRLAFTGSV